MHATAGLFPKLLVRGVPPERLEYCSEVMPSSDPEFCPGSLVPGSCWLPAAAAKELDDMPWIPFSEDVSLFHNVALIRMPPDALDGHLVNQAEWRDSEAKRVDLRERLEELCRPLSSVPAALQHRGTFMGVRGTTSLCTTRHPVGRRLVGLHIDRIDSEPIATIEGARNRLCVNLGPGRRWFVFMPLPLAHVVAACRLSDRDVLTSEHLRCYLKDRRSHVVWRIRLEPGDAYIAPTQILLHDGQSDSQDGERLYTVVGPFDQIARARELSIL
jgi:hypothetical protein